MSDNEPARPTCSSLRDLADTLAMFASQIREHCENADDQLPSPHVIDSWLSEYRNEHKNANAPVVGRERSERTHQQEVRQ